jgi:hypothetical protein
MALVPSARAQSSAALDYRGVALGITLEEFQSAISTRNAGEPRALAEASCILNDWARPDPDQQECEDPQDTARYYFILDDQEPAVWRLRRIVVPGTREDFAPFVEGMDRKFGGSTARAAVAGGIRWTRGRQSVTVRRPPCNEVMGTIVYPGTCAVYSDHGLQAMFDTRRRENQRREF